MANHFRFDLNLIEGLAIVNSNYAANHLRYNDHISKVGSHRLRLLTRGRLPFLLQRNEKRITARVHSQYKQILKKNNERACYQLIIKPMNNSGAIHENI